MKVRVKNSMWFGGKPKDIPKVTDEFDEIILSLLDNESVKEFRKNLYNVERDVDKFSKKLKNIVGKSPKKNVLLDRAEMMGLSYEVVDAISVLDNLKKFLGSLDYAGY